MALACAVVGGTDATFPAYAALAVVYLVGAVLLTAQERRWVWVTGAIVQVVVLGMFVLFGVGLLGPGVFEHEALSDVPVAVWSAAITGLQLVLLGALTYLAGARRGAPALELPPD
jgi:nitrate reductase gamma subunit